MDQYSLSIIPCALRCRDMANSPEEAMRILAKHLDLPMEDAETVDFLRTAFRSAEKEMRLVAAEWRVRKLKEQQ